MIRNYFLFILPLVMVFSCGKDAEDGTPENTAADVQQLVRIKSVSSGSVSVDSFVYDTGGRIVSIISDDDITTMQYTNGKVMTTRKGKISGIVQNVNEISLDAKGRGFLVNSYNKDGQLVAFAERQYDTEGYLIKILHGYPGSQPVTREFIIQNGNVISGKRLNNNQHVANYFYTYFPQQNKLEYAPYAYFPHPDIFGKSIKNLLKEYKEVDLQGKIIYHITIKYELNQKGYPVKIIVTDSLKNEVSYTDEYLYK